jgi:hypothetical protein
MKGYEATGDRSWLDSAKALIDTLYAWQDGDLGKLRKLSPALAGQWQESFKEGLGKTALEYGTVWSSLQYYQRLSGDRSLWRNATLSGAAGANGGTPKKFIGAPSGTALAPGLAGLFETGMNPRTSRQLSSAQTPSPLEMNIFGTVFAPNISVVSSKEFQPGGKRDVESARP